MATISDVINKFRAQSTPGLAPGGDQALGAGGTGVVRRNVEAESVQARNEKQIEIAAGETTSQAQLIAEQRKQASMQRDQEIIQLGQQRKEDKYRFEAGTQKVIDSFEMNKDKLSTAEKMDKMETVASGIRLQDDKYRYDLADAGRRARLDNSTDFDYALKQSIFGDQLDITTATVNFKKLLDLDDVAFTKALADIDLNCAWDVAKTAARSASETAMMSAGGSVVATAAGAYAKQQAEDSRKKGAV